MLRRWTRNDTRSVHTENQAQFRLGIFVNAGKQNRRDQDLIKSRLGQVHRAGRLETIHSSHQSIWFPSRSTPTLANSRDVPLHLPNWFPRNQPGRVSFSSPLLRPRNEKSGCSLSSRESRHSRTSREKTIPANVCKTKARNRTSLGGAE